MNIAGEYQFDYRTFRRVSIDALGKKRVMRWVGGASLTLVLLVTVTSGFEADRLPLLGAAVALIGFPELFAWLSWYPQRQELGQPIHYELDDTEIRVQTATSETKLAWSGLMWIKTQPHAWLARRGAVQIPIPRAAFSPQDQLALDVFLAERKATMAA